MQLDTVFIWMGLCALCVSRPSSDPRTLSLRGGWEKKGCGSFPLYVFFFLFSLFFWRNGDDAIALAVYSPPIEVSAAATVKSLLSSSEIDSLNAAWKKVTRPPPPLNPFPFFNAYNDRLFRPSLLCCSSQSVSERITSQSARKQITKYIIKFFFWHKRMSSTKAKSDRRLLVWMFHFSISCIIRTATNDWTAL